MKNTTKKLDISTIKHKLTFERRARSAILTLLLIALVFSVIYGTLENPFQETLSRIGNRFEPEYRVLFIIWSIVTGMSIQFAVLALFKLENFKNAWAHRFIIGASVFLVLTALIPSVDSSPLMGILHTASGAVFALLITVGFLPFMRHFAKGNTRLKGKIYVWLSITWIGSSSCYLILGNTGIFEMFFFITFLVFLMYITLTMFEERILKRSVTLINYTQANNDKIDELLFPEFSMKRPEKKKFGIRKYLKTKFDE